MPILPVTTAQLDAQQEAMTSRGDVIADPDKIVAPEQQSRTNLATALGPLSDKARRRGGEYGLREGAEDIAGGLIRGLALLPDAAINAIAAKAEKDAGVAPGTFGRDFINRTLRAGNYENVEWLADGLIGIAKDGPDLGTGSALGNVLERSAEFSTLALPYAGALKAMASAGRVNRAAQSGARGFGTGPSAVGPTRPAFDPVSGRAVGEFAPTTTRGKLADALVAPFRVDPVRATKVEMGFGALSGLGAGIEQEAYGTSGITGGLVAPVLGPLVIGTAAKLSPLRFAASKLKGSTVGVADDAAVANRIAAGEAADVAREEGSAAARQLVAGYLRQLEGSPRAASSVERAQQIQSEFGELLFGKGKLIPFQLAEILDDPILQARTLRITQKGGDEAVRAEAQRADDILDTINNYYNNEFAAGVGTGVPGEQVGFVINRLKGSIDETIAANQAEGEALRTTLGNTLPSLDQTARVTQGQTIRENILKSRQEAVEKMAARADAEGLNNIDQIGTPQDWLNFVTEVENTFLPAMGRESITAAGLPNKIQQVLARKDGDFKLSFQDWKQARQELSQDIASFYDRNQGAEAARLSLFADMWDDFARTQANRNTTLQAGSPNLARSSEKLLKYLDDYKNTVAGPYENNYFRAIRQRSGGTDDFPLYQTNAENIADVFLNSPEAAQSFVRIFDETNGLVKDTARVQQQRQAIKDALLDRANREVMGQGAEDPAIADKFNRFINKYSEVIRTLGMEDEFADVKKTIEAASKRLSTLTERSEALNRNYLYLELTKYLDYDPANQGALFDELFNTRNQQKLADIRREAIKGGFVKEWNQTVLDSLNKRVFQNMQGDIYNNPAALKKYLADTKNRQILNNALGEEHVDRVQLLADFADRVNQIMPKTANGRPDFAAAAQMGGPLTFLDKVFKAAGTSVPQATTRFIAIQEGRIGTRAALAYFLARAINSGSSARYDAVLAEALTNPAFARQVMKEAPAEMLPAGQVGLPLKGPRDTVVDFFFKRGVPAAAILGTQAVSQSDPVEAEVEEVTEVAPAPAPAPEPVPEPPPVPVAQAAPVAPRGIASAPQAPPANFAELFPFDTTGQAIDRRRGIASLV